MFVFFRNWRVYCELKGVIGGWRAINQNWFVYYRGHPLIRSPFWRISPSIQNTDCKHDCYEVDVAFYLVFLTRLIFGLENGLVVVDYLSQFVLMNMATADLYGTMDPFLRASSSPKRRGQMNDSNLDDSSIFNYEHQVNRRSSSSLLASRLVPKDIDPILLHSSSRRSLPI